MWMAPGRPACLELRGLAHVDHHGPRLAEVLFGGVRIDLADVFLGLLDEVLYGHGHGLFTSGAEDATARSCLANHSYLRRWRRPAHMETRFKALAAPAMALRSAAGMGIRPLATR